MARLFGYGDLHDYGDYIIVAAENIEEATEIIKKEQFKVFLERLEDDRKSVIFNEDGTPANGCAMAYLYSKDKGYYDMSQKELYEAFCQNEFGKYLIGFDQRKKVYKVEDLGTNIWHGEFA